MGSIQSFYIDIRDTIDFSKVMTQYKLGPNGAIVTALNLFATKFDQVMSVTSTKNQELCARQLLQIRQLTMAHYRCRVYIFLETY